MVAHLNQSASSALLASPGMGADGVVRVQVGAAIGSGVLLYDGRHVLTARHLFEGAGENPAMSVMFETRSGKRSVEVALASGIRSWNLKNVQDDLVLLRLDEAAPRDAERYDLYRKGDEIGQGFVFVGYGVSGTGALGASAEQASATLRRYAENRFDGEMGALKSSAGSLLGWSPPNASQLWADFDNGLSAQDATRLWAGRQDLGREGLEGMITPGDSGSGAFVGGKLAGVASFVFSMTPQSGLGDIDFSVNSSFGEFGVWQRVSYYQQWIDQTVRAAYPKAPTRAEDVQKFVPEGNGGTSYAYFLLQFSGVRSSNEQNVSVDYATRDGTALAGKDYLATSGTLVLYAGENQAVVAVEIIGDTVSEPNEVFYLDVSNPVGGSLGDGVVKLTAQRTIVNDDLVWA